MLFSLRSIAVAAMAMSALPFISAQCLLSYDANTLANNFGKLIASYSDKLANQTLTPDYTDYSESVNTLIDNGGTSPQPLLSATFTSRAGFESASAQQPSVPFQVQNVWYNCDTITIRWLSSQSPQPVVGITVAKARFTAILSNPSLWQISEVWAEFDSAAWLVNLGVKTLPKREVAFTA